MLPIDSGKKQRVNQHKIILITGTSRGIGRFLAEYYAEKGMIVYGCSRGPSPLKQAMYHHIIADITDENQVRDVFSTIRKDHNRLDITINNAGIALMNHVLLTPKAKAQEILNTNFMGTFLVCRESAKLMKKHRFGRIINFSSVAAPMALEGESIYAASKDAVVAFTKIIARELAEFGITCNAVGPAPLKTDLIKGVAGEKIKNVIDRLAIKRYARFEDIANVIDFFIKPESDFITGQVIYLGGI